MRLCSSSRQPAHKGQVMDISGIDPHTSTLRLKLPGSSEKIGLALELQSLTSDACQKVVEENQAAYAEAREKHGEIPKETYEEGGLKLYAATIVGWTWEKDASWGGEQLKFTKANVMKVLSKDFILRQVTEAANEQKRFFAKYAKGS